MAISLKEFHSLTYEPHSAAELRLLYQLYEEAQRGRIAHGERLRAILQGRSVAIESGSTTDANPLLKRSLVERLRALRVSSSARTSAP